MTDPPNVLCVGLACVDFVNVAQSFPNEDSDQRGTTYYWQRGGNASNNCTVLSLMSMNVEFMGILGTSGPEAEFIESDMKSVDIVTKHCPREDCLCPVSTCILSQHSGSRTILHYPRDQPQFSYTHFKNSLQNDFSAYSLIHFEVGINIQDYCQMLECVLQFNKHADSKSATGTVKNRVVISVEVEKPEIPNPELILALADIVFISKDVAQSQGFTDHVSAVKGMYSKCREDACLICPWGSQGAAAMYKGEVLSSPALTDIVAVDTLGAGDTFCAGFIGHALKGGLYTNGFNSSLIQQSLTFGCFLAGKKCSMYGYGGLKEYVC